ncbi:TetR/AcrR family transcriptional regulator [Streptomyces sp. NPDC005438]|uniref:TetR/AcrR family transcriptional regulator n=1 Tax=Streptomyces sp. NPDC005438 TaxID=3156880 RepID=UPI0033ACDC31
MSPRKSDSRQRMIESTVELLRRHGASATSVDRVLAHSQAPRGSVYHHFPGGRAQLVEEAVRHVGTSVSGLIEEAASQGDPRGAVDDFLEMWRQRLLGSDFQAGCSLAAVAVEVNEEAPQLARSAGEFFALWRETLGGLFVRHGLTPERGRRLATLVVTSVEGAVLVCRAERSVAPLDDTAAEIRDLLANAFAEVSGPADPPSANPR